MKEPHKRNEPNAFISVPTITTNSTVLSNPLDIEPRLKKAMDDLARSVGRSAVNHLKQMYPEALAAVTKNAEISLTNHVRNEINHHMKPVLDLLVELKTNGTI